MPWLPEAIDAVMQLRPARVWLLPLSVQTNHVCVQCGRRCSVVRRLGRVLEAQSLQ